MNEKKGIRAVKRLAHFTVRVFPEELSGVRSFYVDVLGLREGRRPTFDFPGHWLYIEGDPIVHLAGNAPLEEKRMEPDFSTGKFNHVAFDAIGLLAMREHLGRLNVPYSEAPVPGFPLTQIFIRDPAGIMVELTYDINELPPEEQALLAETMRRPHPMGQPDPLARK